MIITNDHTSYVLDNILTKHMQGGFGFREYRSGIWEQQHSAEAAITIDMHSKHTQSPVIFVTCKNVITQLDLMISHYNDVIMSVMASQITSLTIVYSTVYPDADQRKHQSSASLAIVRGIHRGPVNSPHKWSVTRKRFLFDDVIRHNVFPKM